MGHRKEVPKHGNVIKKSGTSDPFYRKTFALSYSRKVSQDEIEKNDYNLNISRYISTAKPEEEIDLDEVNIKLVDLEKKITMAENKHNEYLKELGLPLLP